MRIRTSVTGCAFLAAAVGLVPSQQSLADVVVDFSPDTTNAAIFRESFNRTLTFYQGDTFTLSEATTIEGGSIFSRSTIGFVGDPVRFVILPDAGLAPGAVPVLDVFTTLDVVDTTLTTTQPSMTRKHASIPPQELPAGTYWFYLTGAGVDIGQATGIYDNGAAGFGFNLNPDLEFYAPNVFRFGDVFFTLESGNDSDGDGIPDDEDACPDSDLSDTVVIDLCDSGVENTLLDDGCTISDLIAECADDANNHGQFVSCVAQLTNALKQEGIISGREKGAIQRCAGQADIP